MMEWIATIHPWQWLVLGVILLIAETLGVGGFLIGIAIACLLQSAIAAFYPDLSWDFQLLVFALNAVLATVIYWRYFRRFNQQTDQQNLNNRAAQLIGRKLVLEQAYPSGEGRVQIGDTFWRFSCNEPLAEGDRVEVVASQGMVLELKKQ